MAFFMLWSKGVSVMKDKVLYTKDILKLEIAEELGFSEKIRQAGWGELTSAESGKVGGILNRYMRQRKWI